MTCPTCQGTGRVYWTSTGPGEDDGYWTPVRFMDTGFRIDGEQCPNPACDEGEVP